jgi:hypothetical protein
MKKWALLVFLLIPFLLSAQDEGKGGFYSSPEYNSETDFTQSIWNQFAYPQEILQLMKESLQSANYLKYRMEHNARVQSFALIEDLQEDLRVMREVNWKLERQIIFWRIAAIVFTAAFFFLLLSLVLLRNILGSIAQEIRESLKRGLAAEPLVSDRKKLPQKQYS